MIHRKPSFEVGSDDTRAIDIEQALKLLRTSCRLPASNVSRYSRNMFTLCCICVVD